MSFVISAFPGCGKTYFYNKYKDTNPNIRISDSDSSQFSWVLDENGKSTGVRNPEFPSNYIKHIKDLIREGVKLIFVSTHKDVRDALEEAGIKYVLVYPNRDVKDVFIGYYKQRNSPDKFIELMENKWDDFIDGCSDAEKTSSILPLEVTSNEGLSSIIGTLLDSPSSGNMCYMYEN